MDRATVGNAGLQGWRGKVADAVAPAVAKRSGASEDAVRTTIGFVFLVLAVLYVVKAIRALVAER